MKKLLQIIKYQKSNRVLVFFVLFALCIESFSQMQGKIINKELLFFHFIHVHSAGLYRDTSNNCHLTMIDFINEDYQEFLLPDFSVPELVGEGISVPKQIPLSFTTKKVGSIRRLGDSLININDGSDSILIDLKKQKVYRPDSMWNDLILDSIISREDEFVYVVSFNFVEEPHSYKETLWLSTKFGVIRYFSYGQENTDEVCLKSLLVYHKKGEFYYNTVKVDKYLDYR